MLSSVFKYITDSGRHFSLFILEGRRKTSDILAMCLRLYLITEAQPWYSGCLPGDGHWPQGSKPSHLHPAQSLTNQLNHQGNASSTVEKPAGLQDARLQNVSYILSSYMITILECNRQPYVYIYLSLPTRCHTGEGTCSSQLRKDLITSIWFALHYYEADVTMSSFSSPPTHHSHATTLINSIGQRQTLIMTQIREEHWFNSPCYNS